MDCKVIVPMVFENNISELISFYKKEGYLIQYIVDMYNDIKAYKLIEYISSL